MGVWDDALPQLSLEELMGFEGGLDCEDHIWLQWFFLLPITGLWSVWPSRSLWFEYSPMLGTELVLCWKRGLEGAGLTQLSTARGRKVPFPFHAHILQPGAAWDAPAQLLGPSFWGCGCCSSAVLGGITWKGGKGAVLGSSSGREAGCPPGSAVPSL